MAIIWHIHQDLLPSISLLLGRLQLAQGEVRRSVRLLATAATTTTATTATTITRGGEEEKEEEGEDGGGGRGGGGRGGAEGATLAHFSAMQRLLLTTVSHFGPLFWHAKATSDDSVTLWATFRAAKATSDDSFTHWSTFRH